MNATSLHYNFLQERERWSSSPIRIRFLVPVFSCIFTVFTLVSWQIYAVRLDAIKQSNAMIESEITDMKIAYSNVVNDRILEKEMMAELKQLGFYMSSCNRVGESLKNLTNCVSDQLQLTEMRLAVVLPPKEVTKPNPKAPVPLGPTNLTDSVTLRFAGRVHSEGGSATVDAFLRALQSPLFTHVISAAVIPKGAFRQEANLRNATGGGQGEVLVFEISCDCVPRRYGE